MRYLTIGRLSAKSHLVTWGYVAATRLGVEPQVILQMIVRGEMPLLGTGAGGAVLGGLPSDTG